LDGSSAYIDGLKLLARRELSAHQVCQRLARKGHDADAIDAAVARLLAERAIDDARVAEAIARTEAAKRRGRARARIQIERAGIAKDKARRAVDAVFGDLDDDALIETSLTKRLRGRDRIADDRECQRLYRYLIAQGFDHERVMRALQQRRPRRSSD
jgi:regulatory protein